MSETTVISVTAKDLLIGMMNEQNFDPENLASVSRMVMCMAGMIAALLDRVAELEAHQ